MKILLTAGGTGGHIFPAIALAQECQSQGHDVFFVGNANRMEEKEVPKAGFRFYTLHTQGYIGSIRRRIHSFFKQLKAFKEIGQIINNEKPDIIIGFGGYVTIPVIISGSLKKIPVLLHEQNAVIGRANRFLKHFATGIVVCYSQVIPSFKHKPVRLLGNPRASVVSMLAIDKTILADFGLDQHKKTVYIVTGSQGSFSVNHVLKELIIQVQSSPYQFIMVTGRRFYEKFIAGLPIPKHVKIVDFVDQIRVLQAVDCVVSRGGATSLSEILAMGKPSIIIPSPFVPDNHQVANALSIAQNQAGICIEEKDLTAEHLLEQIESILSNETYLNQMSIAARTLSTPCASQDILLWMEELIQSH